MESAGSRYLVVLADDFGMHPAINEGVVRAFVDGVLTDADVIACCPRASDALNLTRQYSIPIGAHVAFTSEWDLYRWGPLTALKSMTAPDGLLHATVEAAWANADESEARSEALEQILRLGPNVTHIGEHMGGDKQGRLERIMSEISITTGIPHKGQWRSYNRQKCRHYAFRSVFSTSGRAATTTYSDIKGWLRIKLLALEPGYHLWVCHPATDSPALERMCTVNWPARPWAREIRGMDLRLLIDPDLPAWLSEYGIRLTHIASAPVSISGGPNDPRSAG